MADTDSVFHKYWLLTASLTGVLGSMLLLVVFDAGGLTLGRALMTGLCGMVFSLVLWGGFLHGSQVLGRFLNRGTPRQAAFRYYLGWFVLLGLLYGIAAFLVWLILGINVLDSPGTVVVSGLISLGVASVITGYEFLKAQVATSRDLALAQARSQALVLKAQLGPHTLHNSLNTIAALIPEDPRLAEASVEALSRLMRRVMAALEDDAWALEEEFSLIQDLLSLERARFGPRLEVHLVLPEADRDTQVPPLILLPLVENALKHGFRPKVGTCHLRVTASGQVLRVEDDGVGRPEGCGEGVGLATVRQRLEAQGGTLLWPRVEAGCVAEVRLCP